MTGVFIIGVLAGLALLIGARQREYGRDVDAFEALDRLDVAGPLAMRPAYWAAAGVSVAASLLGLPALSPTGSATAGVALAIVVWLVWLGVWVDLRWLLDAAVVFQDHVPLERRPALAFGRAPHAALSFRPMTAALVLLGALAATGLGFGVLGRQLGWTRLLPLLAAAVWAAIGLAFAAYVRSAISAERNVRLVLGDPAKASDEALFDALRRNPRSARLLVEHARRLEASGDTLQALLEYRAAELSGYAAEEAAEGVARTRRRLGGKVGPLPGAIVRRRRSADARMEIEPLVLDRDAVHVRVLDGERFLGELLGLTDEGLILSVQGEVEAALAERLRPYEHLAPLVPDDPARPHLASLSWRLTPEVREQLRGALREHGVPGGWVNVHVYTIGRMLVEARSHFALVRVAPDIVQREFIEWRRAAAVGPLGDDAALQASQG